MALEQRWRLRDSAPVGGFAYLIGSRDCLLIEAFPFDRRSWMTDSPVALARAANVAAGRRTPLERADPAGPKRAAQLVSIGEECVGRRVVLSLAGELDISNAAELHAAIESAGSRAFEIWLDLRATTFMDSSALHAMAQERQRLSRTNVEIALICPDGPVLRLLKLTGFDRIFEIHVSRTAANHATAA